MIFVRHGQSEFNVHFAKTRQDPGIPDPALTEEGRRQARQAAEILRDLDIRHLLASPFTRALQTAEIIADTLRLPVEIEPLVHEHAAFICDIGTPASALGKTWPNWRFDHLPERWWPDDEQEDAMLARCQRFRERMAMAEMYEHTAIVSHWGFIRGLTGLRVTNGAVVRVAKQGEAELLHPVEPALP
ncbi:MAG: histidine phosphatase family protein [Alphaproteobacteria bacterium]|nr:histidine phosphatase family protein [Alphaproteobacteria bacterium]MBU0798916.1 histidine phosphatase family protein [Alphaproteobacteria bacterium]MBU0886304.1 histidine phosphatase family protein [Alphaproteobacteria bacterium]MBU1813500.1 histidine phosphatase family protein [Alphaproteobacteria bacterium]MBU2091698.1 histidine phosphatase family protein [Alphaproteobacteria bacterium]